MNGRLLLNVFFLSCAAQSPPAIAKESPTMNVRVGSIYQRGISEVWQEPSEEIPVIRMALWRDERGSARILLRSEKDLAGIRFQVADLKSGECPTSIGGENILLRRVRTVGAGEHGPTADPLETFESLELRATQTQAVWITVRIPPGTCPGTYHGTINLVSPEGVTAAAELAVRVLPVDLPAPEAYSFWLDLWQHPAAVARVHDLPLWSEPHWAVLKDTLRMLAEAGQKVITATIIHDPWGSQTYDPHVSMVTWYREQDGTLSFDFSVFDRYVKTCMEVGIKGAIHCYSTCLGPGKRTDCVFRVTGRDSGQAEDIVTQVGDEVYKRMWKQFFAAFVPHLRERGWLEKTGIGMDEKPPEVMEPMLAMLREAAPELRVALAGRYHTDLDAHVWDYCVFYPGPEAEVPKTRRKTGRKTTFYTCCGPPSPNTFTHSPPVESRQLPWQAAASGLDGYLRWAYNAWNRSPLEETAFGNWPPGDCFLVYPGPRSSIRFELLKQGIQDYEAIQFVRSQLPESSPLREQLEAAVRRAAENIEDKAEAARRVEQARALANSLAVESLNRKQ